MANTYFRTLTARPDGGRYLAGPDTAGPWDPRMQHGGPPNALAVRVAERLAAEVDPAADPPAAARLASEFVGPVPVGEIEVSAEVVRAARSAILVAVTVAADGRACLHSRVWLVRPRDTGAVAPSGPPPPPVPATPPSFSLHFPYASSIDWHEIDGAATASGPAAVWARPRLGLVDGEGPDVLSGLQRVALIGDSTSGVSSALDWEAWTFLNVDLDIHLSRPVGGEWVYLDAVTDLGPAGFALARSRVSDASGPVGTTAQTLMLAPRPR